MEMNHKGAKVKGKKRFTQSRKASGNAKKERKRSSLIPGRLSIYAFTSLRLRVLCGFA
jgi:hypothetical protein